MLRKYLNKLFLTLLMNVELKILEIMKKLGCSWEEAKEKEKEVVSLKKFF